MRCLLLAGVPALALACGGEGLPDVPLKLSKNCNEVEVEVLAARVGAGAGEEVLDVAADGSLGTTAWVLVRRTAAAGDVAVVQRIGAAGIELELELPTDASASLSLSPAPETGQVWVVRDEPSRYELWRVAPDDPLRPLLASDDFSSFPASGSACPGCESEWPRRLFFLPSGPALVSLPPSSEDAALVVIVAPLYMDGAEIVLAGPENILNFQPPCEAGNSPEAELFCEEQRMNLRYPAITVLGIQQDPRQLSTTLFGHRTRAQSYDGETFPLESSDTFMVTLSLGSNGVPVGVLRSYSGFYVGVYEGPIGDDSIPPLPTADPPYGMAIDRFTTYGLFSHGGRLARLVKLPDRDPEFVELSDRVPLPLDTSLLQLDLDVALGRLVDGAWEITKLFPDDPSQSRVLLYGEGARIERVVSGGIGTFMLRKQDAPPEVVRVRCAELGMDGETGPDEVGG